MKGTVLVLGATSPIARAVAASFAERGHPIHLGARDAEAASRIAWDLGIRYGVAARWSLFDAHDIAHHEVLLAECDAEAGGELDGVVLAFGLLGDQARAEHDVAHAEEILEVNLGGAVSILTHAANLLESKRRGFIIGIASVAGDRGRQSNYVYGAAKAGLAVFLGGLRGRLAASGVRVLTVKPGFVDTPMTFGRAGMFAVARPERVGEAIVRALEHGREVVYLPGFWRAIMGAVRIVPEKVFKRLKI